MILRRSLILALTGLMLVACAPKQDLSQPPEPLGDFKLGYNIVVVNNPEIGPLSRKATDAEWKAALEKAIADRFGRFQGTGEYHIAVKLHAYALGQVGVPLVVSPKSVVVITADIWRPTGKISPKPEQMTVWEGVDGKTLVGSGLTQSKEVQMQRLAFNAALKIEEWMRTHPEWFVPNGPVVPGSEPRPTEG
jgi:hypothetical protein